MSTAIRIAAGALAAGASLAAWADADFSGQLRLRVDDRQAARQGPLAQGAQMAPELIALPASSGSIDTELRGRWNLLSAAVALRQERPESAAWHNDAAVNELYASGDAGGWQFSAGRKIVAWDVGYGFRPNDVVQQEARRTLLTSTQQGRALVQAEHFDARTAWSLVWVNPQRATEGDASQAFGADEQALAARVYTHIGAADWHGFARWGQHTRSSLGAATSWVASDSLELHASMRWAERADVLVVDPSAQGLVGSPPPYRIATQSNRQQFLLGGTWTAENKLSLMAELWYDGTAASDAQWDAWNARNQQLTQTWVPGGPAALRRGVAGNLGWQTQAFGGQSLRRHNVFVRVSWDHEGWQPSIDMLYMPADRGRVVTAALGWQGDRLRVDAGWRVNAGPSDSVAAQLPVKRTAFAALTWAF